MTASESVITSRNISTFDFRTEFSGMNKVHGDNKSDYYFQDGLPFQMMEMVGL